MHSTENAKYLGSRSSLPICCLLLLLLAVVLQPAASQTQSSQRYLQNVDINNANNERLQQILKGSGAGAAPAQIWPQPPLKAIPDVKTELAKLNSTYTYQNDWPANNVKLGAVTAVSFDKAGNVVIFHRVNRVWGQQTFDNRNVYQEQYLGPIRESTILALEPATGAMKYDWGKNFFYMPHGLTVDPEDNVWVTDVAMHQVFKFPPRGGDGKPLLTLGTAFKPGSGKKFCKPTSVAVLDNGDFFVADGYCNARILKYSRAGELITSWGQNSFSGVSYDVAPQNYFAIPHALTLVPELELLCAADRENGRVQCFFSRNGTFHSQYHSQLIGDRLFSMAYTPASGGQLVIVNGPTAELGIHPEHYNEVHGFVLSMRSKQLVSKFGPNNLEFHNPHDVAVTTDGNEIYVAELAPMRIHKFVHRSLTKPLSLSATKDTSNIGTGKAGQENAAPGQTVHHPSGKAILVASLMLLFAGSTFALALLFARRRKRGCLPFGSRSRRHAWEKSDGFKLGGLLDRDRNGFEKLDQQASDEEQDTTTTLASAQYA
ncbi:peptidyl-alpha-hydroxyglycine alpha-amidating lyase 1 isoform X1 [Drosophila kikkawai]|uniref:peptidylamidoglycolate lyase n=1 Tax=Drosophila kikkawai TaxID=30033 RepID=A0A6P4IZ75_DROKI|nr:peptidyl-alpha-hydroxyglycine alpha-amidating lyase 1 isoform X1 [Drosophila kikkawai]